MPTYTIITTTPADEVGRVHDRMPMAIAEADWDNWLDPRSHAIDAVLVLMAPPLEVS